MSDYILYIDDALIEKADTLFRYGNFCAAGKLYKIALAKLRKYNGDRSYPILLASTLANNLKLCNQKCNYVI